MVYAQHEWDAEIANRILEDFPAARFIHTIRDPISAFDRLFDRWFSWYGNDREAVVRRSRPIAFRIDGPLQVMRTLAAGADCPIPVWRPKPEQFALKTSIASFRERWHVC